MAKKTSDPFLLPVELVSQRFNRKGISDRQLSSMLNLSQTGFSKWRYRGVIPRTAGVNYDEAILTLAQKNGVRLSAEELIRGGVL